MKKVISFLLVIAITVSLAACGSGGNTAESPTAAPSNSASSGSSSEAPAQTYTLMYNHALTEQDPYHGAFLAWADAVHERTGGGIDIQVFASSQLGVEEDIIEQIKEGANIGQNTDFARLGNYVPELAAFNAPYFADTFEEVQAMRDLDCVQEWMQQLEDNFGLKVVSFMTVQGFRSVATNTPIYNPDDLSSLLIRTAGAPIWQESVKAIGATPVALARSEIYSAVQTKNIDGLEDVYTAIDAGKLYEVLNTVSETKHILLINPTVVSAEWFYSLPEEYQQILVEECDKASIEISNQIMGSLAEEAKKSCIDNGMTIIEQSELDMEAFYTAAERAYDALNLTEARDAVYAELGKTR